MCCLAHVLPYGCVYHAHAAQGVESISHDMHGRCKNLAVMQAQANTASEMPLWQYSASVGY
jgi:hypothetical protein